MGTGQSSVLPVATGDLRPTQQRIKDALLDMGCHPIEHTHFTPETGTVGARPPRC